MRAVVRIHKKQYNLPKEKIRKYLMLIATSLRQIRKERIDAGQCVDGSPMLTGPVQTMNKGIKISTMAHHPTAQYSPKYERRKMSHKKNAGRRALYSPGDRLRLSGAMLNSQHVTAQSWNRVVLGFSGEVSARAYKNDILRPFIKFTSQEVRQAVSDAKSEMRKG